jgi:hypothetical protein
LGFAISGKREEVVALLLKNNANTKIEDKGVSFCVLEIGNHTILIFICQESRQRS